MNKKTEQTIEWDSLALYAGIRRIVDKHNRAIGYRGGYSLSDGVCVVKESARQIVESMV